MEVPSNEVIDYFDANRTEEDVVWMHRCADAEARGDAETALDCHHRSIRIAEAPHGADLAHLARLGNRAPAWLVCRWVSLQAYQWLLLSEDPRVDRAVRLVLAATYDLPDDLDPMLWYELGTQAVAADWLVREVATHTLSGLVDFLDVRAQPPLLARADRIRDWAGTPLRVFRYGDLRGDTLTVTDLSSGETRRVLHLGSAAGVGPGATVLGRVVPMDSEPGLLFESRPLEVDRQTALELVDVLGSADLDAWVWALAAAVRAGRQPCALGRVGGTPLWSDVLHEPGSLDHHEPAGRIQDLMDAGLPRRVAEAVGTCELALLIADIAPESLPVAASHAAVGLSHPAVLAAVREHSTGPANAAGWSAVAACLPEPLRASCVELAAAD